MIKYLKNSSIRGTLKALLPEFDCIVAAILMIDGTAPTEKKREDAVGWDEA